MGKPALVSFLLKLLLLSEGQRLFVLFVLFVLFQHFLKYLICVKSIPYIEKCKYNSYTKEQKLK